MAKSRGNGNFEGRIEKLIIKNEFGGGQQQAQSKGLLGGVVGSVVLPLYLIIVFSYALYLFFRGTFTISSSFLHYI